MTTNHASGRIRVAHTVDTYLNLSENWIYPQIVAVPNVDSIVLCYSTANVRSFPLPRKSLLLSTLRPAKYYNPRRLANWIARIAGHREARDVSRLQKWGPKVIHAHFGTRGWRSLHLIRTLRAPLVTSFYGYDAWLTPTRDPSWKARYRELFEQGALFLAEGERMAERLLELNCPPAKLRVHRIGVDVTSLTFHRRDFSGGLHVLLVGRFVEKKGLTDGLRACAIAHSRGVKIKITVIGGAGINDAQGAQIAKEMRDVASSGAFGPAVTFTGFLPVMSVRQALCRHNVLLCPSKHSRDGDAEGGSPVILTEAMAAGLFCIGTRHCDIPQVIRDGETGYLCDEGDVLGMANALSFIANNPAQAERVTLSGRAHVERKFCLATQLAGLYVIYRDLALANEHSAIKQTEELR